MSVQIYDSDYDRSYMFRLRNVSNIRLCVSEVQKGELYVCSLSTHTYSYKTLIDDISAL
jgi:hypothetical protein